MDSLSEHLQNQKDLHEEILFTKEQIETRIEEMALAIIKEYEDKPVIFVSLLNGAQPFATKLMFAINRADPYFLPNLQSMILSRYGDSLSSGKINIVTDLPPSYRDLKGYDVVLVDDLIDEGGTLAYASKLLKNYGAKSVNAVVLVKKDKKLSFPQDIFAYGFDAPDKWLTGMGMDDPRIGKEANRWAEWIAIALDEVKAD